MSEFFKFEYEKKDFPFYNGKPEISSVDWIILSASILLFISTLILPINLNRNLTSVLFCLELLIPLIYVSKGNLKLFFRKPKLSDLKIIAICLVGYYMYGMFMAMTFIQLGIKTYGNAIINYDMDLMFWISSIIQLLGEELFKIILFIILMYAIYKITKNRKISIVLSALISIIAFGMLHYNAYNGAIAQILVIIGFGSIFTLFSYLKTKNVVVSYILHIIIDSIVFLLVMLVKSFGIEITQMLLFLV